MRAGLLLFVAAACSSPSSTQHADAHGPGSDANDGSGSAIADAPGSGGSDDGTPTRMPCTNNYGNALSTQFGRLDGFLVAIIQPGNGSCNADQDHVHLQIEMNDAIYDVAIDVASSSGPNDVHTLTRDGAMIGSAWAEGWHTLESLDYPTTLDVHSADLTLETPQQLASEITSDLATVNHISIFSTGYGPDGSHLVHREGSSHDGMLVTEPLSATTHQRLFSFSDQSF